MRLAAASITALLSTALLYAQQTVPIAPAALTLDGVLASSVTHDNRDGVRLIEADNARGGGMAIVNGLSFRDGSIEVDVAGRRGPYAVPADRGFVGIAFRISADRGKSEYIYLRPDNGRAENQVQRNHSIQYASHPDFPWPRMRKEFPEQYESYVDLQPGVWTRMRIDVARDERAPVRERRDAAESDRHRLEARSDYRRRGVVDRAGHRGVLRESESHAALIDPFHDRPSTVRIRNEARASRQGFRPFGAAHDLLNGLDGADCDE
jgi:hypothetical protein